jgi:hypothetical protein
MKKVLFGVLMGLLISGGISLPAQETKTNYKESDYYYFSFPVEKVYSYRAGYMVIYRKTGNLMGRTYIPVEWFTNPTGKAEIINLRPGTFWPTLTVYYKSGEFSHVRLYVRHSHSTWGIVPAMVNLDEYFTGVEELKLEF